jgi:hypothetical protein
MSEERREPRPQVSMRWGPRRDPPLDAVREKGRNLRRSSEPPGTKAGVVGVAMSPPRLTLDATMSSATGPLRLAIIDRCGARSRIAGGSR